MTEHKVDSREEWLAARIELLAEAKALTRAGRSQLLVYHLMFGPDDEAACEGCSFTADNFAGGGRAPRAARRDVRRGVPCAAGRAGPI
jgi:predicted dithiol-disulfide oxidoreductase (DUF899 family)